MKNFLKKIKVKLDKSIKSLRLKIVKWAIRKKRQAEKKGTVITSQRQTHSKKVFKFNFSKIFNSIKSAVLYVANQTKSLFYKIINKPLNRQGASSLKDRNNRARKTKTKFSFKTWIKTKHAIACIALGVFLITVPIVILSATSGKAASSDEVENENVVNIDELFGAGGEVDLASVSVTAKEIGKYELKPGVKSPYVAELQEKLMNLGFMDHDEPTENYGSMTKAAVALFQRQHNLAMDGIAGKATWDVLEGGAKPYTITKDTKGTDVKELQLRLRELGYTDSATGTFTEDTVNAVKKFQERNGLSVDGKIGLQTKEALYSENVKANSISYGEESQQVKKYQERLKKLGYLTTEPDGKFGVDTVNAVKKFQEDNGLIADGYVGPTTKDLLMSSKAEANVVALSDKSETVKKIQNRLITLKYLGSGSATGYFGSSTESAVKAFQKRNSLTQDGKVGANTMKVLFSDGAKKAATSSGSKTGGSSSTNKTANQTKVQQLISIAKSKLGCKYIYGAKGANTFDCSGFVYWCLNQVGVRQGYMTSAGWRSTTKYPKVTNYSQIAAGDVVVFRGHVGIAIGGGQMIDASSTQGKIRISPLSQGYWKTNFICAFRIL